MGFFYADCLLIDVLGAVVAFTGDFGGATAAADDELAVAAGWVAWVWETAATGADEDACLRYKHVQTGKSALAGVVLPPKRQCKLKSAQTMPSTELSLTQPLGRTVLEFWAALRLRYHYQ